MKSLAAIFTVGAALLLLPALAVGQEIPARPGDRITASARGKSDEATVTERPARSVTVEVVAPRPPEDEDFSYANSKPTFFKKSRKQAYASDFNLISEIPEGGIFRIRVWRGNGRDPDEAPVDFVPITIRSNTPGAAEPSTVHAHVSDIPAGHPAYRKGFTAYITPVITLSQPIPKVMTIAASRGDEIIAEVDGSRDSATVVALPANGYIPDRGYIRQYGDPMLLPTPFERKKPQKIAEGVDCSCRSVTLHKITSNQYTRATGWKIFGNTWHYKKSVLFQVGDQSNPPEKGRVVIPWREEADVMSFHFTFPQALGFIMPENQHLCRAIVEVTHPHWRRSSGSTKDTFVLYSKQGMAMATASRNIIAYTAAKYAKQRSGAGRIRWAVGAGYCSDGVPFEIR